MTGRSKPGASHRGPAGKPGPRRIEAGSTRLPGSAAGPRKSEGLSDTTAAMLPHAPGRQTDDEAVFQVSQMLQLVLDTIPQRVFWKDRNSVYVGCNAPAALDAGYERPDQLTGRTDYDMTWRQQADAFRADDRLVMESGIPKLNYLEPQTRPDGSKGWSRTSKLPLRDRNGKVIGVLGMYEDATDQIRSEEELRQSEERYRRLIESTTDYVVSVVLTEGRWVIASHSPGSTAVTGYSADELPRDPQQMMVMVLPEDRAAVQDTLRRVEGGEQVPPIEHRVVRKDGSTRWVRNTIVLCFENEVLVGYDALVQDVTERRALQEQLLEAQKMEGIGRLAGGVAHDFNNLLTAILGYVELARLDLPADLPPNHSIRTDLAEIGVAGERASTLTRQLLTFASKQAVAPIRLDLSALVVDLLKILRPLLGEDVIVETALEPSRGCIEADPGQIQQLLVNLAANARDAMPDGGRFTIETSAEEVTRADASQQAGLRVGPYVSLSVSDTGSGMSEEIRSHLFEPFFTTKERGKGTGLGLAICHGIVRQLGGQIRVFSEAGSGTTFRILLPRVDGPADALPEAPILAPTARGTETILLVEDEPMVRRLATIGLRAQGYTVLEASGGEEALEIAGSVGPQIDLIVSDVVMPGFSGPGLLKRVAAAAPRARCLLVSGHAESTVMADGAGEGTAFLPKPFTPGRLARKVREVLDSPPRDTASD